MKILESLVTSEVNETQAAPGKPCSSPLSGSRVVGCLLCFLGVLCSLYHWVCAEKRDKCFIGRYLLKSRRDVNLQH